MLSRNPDADDVASHDAREREIKASRSRTTRGRGQFGRSGGEGDTPRQPAWPAA